MLKDFLRRRFTAPPAVLPAHPEPAQVPPPPATGAFTAECLAACFVPALLADYHALLATRDPRNAVVVTTRYAPLDEALQHALAQALGRGRWGRAALHRSNHEGFRSLAV